MTSIKPKQEAQNPLILRCHRIIEAFAKSDDERDFYLDKKEGFLIYCNLDKSEEELKTLEEELKANSSRYCLVPKMSFYETKKIMEGFVNEKVYDIDTKEKLLDIISAREARENFLEFIHDHHTEMEKWQQYYQERSRIRIIEWLRSNHFHFVFEEDLDLPAAAIEKLKRSIFETKVSKDIITARKTLATKAKSYYSNEALNPRPKRGRPPKQAIKLEVELQFGIDIFLSLPPALRPFLFAPDTNIASVANFSAKFDVVDEDLLATRRSTTTDDVSPGNLSQQLSVLRSLSSRWVDEPASKSNNQKSALNSKSFLDDDDDDDDDEFVTPKRGTVAKSTKKISPAVKSSSSTKTSATKTAAKSGKTVKETAKKPAAKPAAKKAAPKATAKTATKASAKAAPTKKGGLRTILKSSAAKAKAK